MINEILLISSLIVIFGVTLLAYYFLGKSGMYMMTTIATIMANIECLIIVDAFGMEQTLGNVFFAVTFLITDILSENEGKKEANKSVLIGIFTSVFFIVVTQSWMLYTPSQSDWVMPAINSVFSQSSRTMLASLVVYAISQIIDVRLYHTLWALTEKLTGDKDKFLWLRNNAATLISQAINTVFFTLFAFGGMYDVKTLINIMMSSYVIFIVTSLCDTPVLYLSKKVKKMRLNNKEN